MTSQKRRHWHWWCQSKTLGEGIIYSIYTHTGITSSAIYGGGGTYSHERIHWWADLSSNGQKSSIPPCWSIVNDIKSPTFNMFWSVQQNLIVLRFDAIIIYASFEGWKVCFIKIKVTTCVQWWDPIRVHPQELALVAISLHSQNYVMTTVLMQGWGCLGSYCKMLLSPCVSSETKAEKLFLSRSLFYRLCTMMMGPNLVNLYLAWFQF